MFDKVSKCDLTQSVTFCESKIKGEGSNVLFNIFGQKVLGVASSLRTHWELISNNKCQMKWFRADSELKWKLDMIKLS